MKVFCALTLPVLTLLWKDGKSQEPIGYCIDVPPTVTVQEGLSIVIPCNFTTAGRTSSLAKARGSWRKQRNREVSHCFLNETNDEKFNSQNFNLTGNVTNGECNLTVTDAKKSDYGSYYFHIEGDRMNHSYMNTVLTIQVTDLTDKPKIIQPKIRTLISGENVTFTCKAPGMIIGRGTPPKITWERRSRVSNASTSWITYRKAASNISFILSPMDDQTTVTCNVMFVAVNKSTEKEFTLKVQYLPTVSISVKTTEGIKENQSLFVETGDSISLVCSVGSNPPANVSWIKGEKMFISRTDGSRLEINLLNMTYGDAGTYRCEASNQHGNASREIYITFNHSPSTPETFSNKFYDKSLRDMMIGGVGGISIGIFILLCYGLIIKLRNRKKRDTLLMGDEVNDTIGLYNTVNKAKPMENPTKDVPRPDMGVNDNQEDVHYASICFTKTDPKNLQ